MISYILFLRHHKKTLGEIVYEQVIHDSLISILPSSVHLKPPGVWRLMFELILRVVFHQCACDCVNMSVCICARG